MVANANARNHDLFAKYSPSDRGFFLTDSVFGFGTVLSTLNPKSFRRLATMVERREVRHEYRSSWVLRGVRPARWGGRRGCRTSWVWVWVTWICCGSLERTTSLSVASAGVAQGAVRPALCEAKYVPVPMRSRRCGDRMGVACLEEAVGIRRNFFRTARN